MSTYHVFSLVVLGDLRGARGELEGARQAYAELGDLVGPSPSRLLFLSWLRRGGLAVEHAELEEAAQALAQAVEVARELQDPWSRAMTFLQGGEIEARRGRLARERSRWSWRETIMVTALQVAGDIAGRTRLGRRPTGRWR